MVSQKNWNLRIATRASRSHSTGTEYSVIQNTLESVALICRCGYKQVSSVSNTETETRYEGTGGCEAQTTYEGGGGGYISAFENPDRLAVGTSFVPPP